MESMKTYWVDKGSPGPARDSGKVRVEDLMEGQLIVLNEAFNVVDACGFDPRGEVVKVAEVLDDGRVMVLGRTDDERVVTLSQPMRRTKLKVGDNLLVSPRTGFAVEKMPKSTVDEVMLEEVPDVTYEDIGGLGDQIEVLRDSIELPYLHVEEFKQYAAKNPVLVEVDFPRSKALSDATRQQNQKLAKQFGIQGYPTLIILDSSGKQIGKMGYVRGGPGPFIKQLGQITK